MSTHIALLVHQVRGLLGGTFLLLLISIGAVGKAQTDPPAPSKGSLFETIAVQDKLLFDAYNHCDLATLGSMVTDDLEFYHDKTGLATGKQSFLDSIRKYICGKVTRELMPASLEVHELAGYGAVELGVHRFHHPGEQDHGVVGEAKFVMLWQNKGGVWKVARVISYDHEAISR